METVPPAAKAELGEKNEPPQTPAVAGARSMLQFLPKDRNTVVHLDWKRIRSGTLREQKVIIELEEKSLPIREKCGFKISELVSSVTVGFTSDKQPEETLIAAVAGDFDREGIERCLVSVGGQPTEQGQYNFGEGPFHMFWPADGVVMISPGVSAEQMRARLREGSVLDHVDLMPWVRRTDSHAEVWGAALGPGLLADGLRSFGGGLPLGMYLNVDIDEEISAFLSVQFNDEGTTSQIESLMRSVSSQAGTNLGGGEIQMKSLDVNRDGTRLDLLMRLVTPEVAPKAQSLP